MNGPEIFTFTLREIPKNVRQLLDKAQLNVDDIDLFIFHQANAFMLEHLRKRMKISDDRFFVYMRDCGNTVSSTIPIALKEAMGQGAAKSGSLIMLVGFGVGYSWGSVIVRMP